MTPPDSVSLPCAFAESVADAGISEGVEKGQHVKVAETNLLPAGAQASAISQDSAPDSVGL